jgi:hypothetical protein
VRVHPRHLSCPREKISRFAKESGKGIEGWRVVRGNKRGGSSATYEVQTVKKETSYWRIKSSPSDLGSQACISHSWRPLPDALPCLQGSAEVERTSVGWSSLFFHNALGRLLFIFKILDHTGYNIIFLKIWIVGYQFQHNGLGYQFTGMF